MSETFEEIQYRLLVKNVESLKIFVERAPTIGGTGFGLIIGQSIAMVLQRAAGVYGDAIYQAIGRQSIRSERERLGFCPMCSGSPNPISEKKTPHGGSWGMCDVCLASAQAYEEETVEAADA